MGNLDRRGIGDLTALTVAAYEAASRTGRLLYRVYRHPVVMVGFGPAGLVPVQHRRPIAVMKAG